MLELLLIIILFALLMFPVNVSMETDETEDEGTMDNEEAFGIVIKDIEEPISNENIIYDTAFKEIKIKTSFYNYTKKETVEFMSAMLNKGFTATDIAAWVA